MTTTTPDKIDSAQEAANTNNTLETHYATQYSTLGGFGLRQLQKYGFKIGSGLGKNEDGGTTYVNIDKKFDTKGLGAQKVEENLHEKIQDAYELLLSKAKPVKSSEVHNDSDSESTDRKKKKKSKKSKDEKKKSSKDKKKKKKSKKNKEDADETSSDADHKKKDKKRKRGETKENKKKSENDSESDEKQSRQIERQFLITAAAGKEKREEKMSTSMAEHLEKLRKLRDQQVEQVKNKSLLTQDVKESLSNKKRRIK